MSELDIQVPGVYDPFADANIEDSDAGTKEYVHVRIQQRNGRKSLTTVQGVKKDFNYNKILKDFKKEFCCNGTVVQDTELGQDVTGGGGAMRCWEKSSDTGSNLCPKIYTLNLH